MADRPVQSTEPQEEADGGEERGTGPIKAWSYSRLQTFEKCPYRAYLAYVEKRPEPEDMDKTALIRGRHIHELAEQFIRGDIDAFPDELSKFEDDFMEARDRYAQDPDSCILEDKWAFNKNWEPVDDYFGDDVWFRMAIDWGFMTDGHAHFVDHKTGKERPIPHAQQRMLYAVTLFMRYPHLETASGGFWYLDIGTQRTRMKDYSREEAMKFLPGITDRALAMTETTEFPARPNRMNCKWCPYGEVKGDKSCPWRVT